MNNAFSLIPLFFAAGGAEILKLHVLASLFFLIPGPEPFPLLPTSLSFYAALILGFVLRGSGGRIVYHLLCHLLGFIVSFAFIAASYRGLPFGSIELIFREGTAALNRLRTPMETFAFVLVVVWSLAFWIRGTLIGRKVPTPETAVTRFDTGIGLFIMILFLAFGIRMKNPVAESLILPFFIFGILSLGTTRSYGNLRGGLSRRSKTYLVLPFAAGFFLAASGFVLLLPSLFAPAASAGESVVRAFGYVEPWLVALIRFLFMFQAPSRPAETASGAGPRETDLIPPHEAGFWERLFERILGWGLVGIISSAAFLLACYGLWRLARFLLSRAESRGRPFRFGLLPAALLAFFAKLGRGLAAFIAVFFRKKSPRSPARRAYARLLAWGAFGGVVRKQSETPLEYGRRLASVFPENSAAGEIILRGLLNEVYGGFVPGREEAGSIKKARRSFGGLVHPLRRLIKRFGPDAPLKPRP